MEGEDIIDLQLSNDVLVNVDLRTNCRQKNYINVKINVIDMDDGAPHIVKLGDVEHHAQLMSTLLLENLSYFIVNEIIILQKLV